MSDVVHKDDCQRYLCRCLNVQVQCSTTTQTSPPISHPLEEYKQVYVKEDGIVIAHPQLVLRTRTRSFPVPNSSSNRRYTFLTCIVCDTVVYRVEHAISADLEGKEGPVLPSSDWAEEEVLKSSTGFIEIHRNCLKGDEVARLREARQFSPLYHVVLPASTSEPSGIPLSASPTLHTDDPQRVYFSHLRPLFPSPPFIPTHPTFKHLAEVAEAESTRLRTNAQIQVASIVKEKIEELLKQEDALRSQVETLWRTYRSHVDKLGGEARLASNALSSRNRIGDIIASPTGAPETSSGTPQKVRDFVPSKAPERPPPVRQPRISSLSASLATSTFHHPKAQEPRSTETHATNGARSPDSLDSASSITLTTSPQRGEGSTVLHYRRTNDETINTATSYRYFLNLEEEMQRRGRARKAQLEAAGQNGESEKPAETKPRTPPATTAREESSKVTSPTSPNGKGKRKVTFDVKTKPEDEQSENDVASDIVKDDGMLFDLDEEDGDHPRDMVVMPYVEQPPAPRPGRVQTTRTNNGSDLSTSFPALRPSSLPPPSTFTALDKLRGPAAESKPIPLAPRPESSGENNKVDEPEPLDELTAFRQAELMKLLAAKTPSHRAAWKRNSTAWQSFLRKQRQVLDEDNANPGQSRLAPTDEDDTFVPGSLAIPYQTNPKPKDELSLASYRPETAVQQPKTHHRRVSRDNSQDPGVLDFAGYDDDDEEGEEPSDLPVNPGQRSRQHALKILEARSRIPEAGMWRSLA